MGEGFFGGERDWIWGWGLVDLGSFLSGGVDFGVEGREKEVGMYKVIVRAVQDQVVNRIPEGVRDQAFLKLFGLAKIPMIFFLSPRLVKLNGQTCQIMIPLTRRSRNHLNCMYFGALATGADCAGALAAMKQIQKSGKKISLIFKSFEAEFLKRAEGDTLFTCDDVPEMTELVERAIASGERENRVVKVVATVPSKGPDPVAEFKLTLSLKARA